MFKVLNTDKNDFSDEFLVLMAIVGYCMYGAQIIMGKCSRICDLHKLSDSFFQRKKLYVNEAAKAYDRLVGQITAGFDGWFDKVQRGRVDYCTYIHQNANDLMRLMLLYYSRTENHPERREDIFKAIESFPIDDEADYDAIMDYFLKKF